MLCKMSLSFRYGCICFPALPARVPGFLLIIVRFEQRNLNNAFAYDLVPSPSVLTAALKAARRVNDFPTAVRIFEGMYLLGWSMGATKMQHRGTGADGIMILGIKAKVENRGQYDQYLEELKPLREELGVSLKEDLYPEEAK